MTQADNNLLLAESEKPGWFQYPPQFLHVMELGIYRLDPWQFILGEFLRTMYAILHKRYPNRELVPFAKWEDLVACWDKDKPGKVVVVDIALTNDPGLEFDSFWDWFQDAVHQM